jgi:tryptophan-rich sensory protein
MDVLLVGIFRLACCAAGATGAAFPPGRWYETLEKPAWTPPDWAFPLAWTTIYLLISFAGARVAVLDGNGLALAFWAVQAGFSTLWTPIFFGLRRMKAALLVMVPLWGSVAACTWFNFQLDFWAGVAFLPYLAWVSVAAALNAAVWRLNPGVAPVRPSEI